MSIRTESKCKACRREGEKLFRKGDKCSTAKCPFLKRSYRPGVHGPNSRVRQTSYGKQLREKQKAKETYGVQERQFRIYFDKAKRSRGNTAARLVEMLEMRLDNIVYRLGLAISRPKARQMVSHGLIRVNGRKVNIASCQVKPGSLISLSDRAAKSKILSEEETGRLVRHQAPSWLLLDAQERTGKVLNRPQGDDLKRNFDPTLIVEFYSR
ncbi:30S ribosomal protein S4 [Candidatus Uhrbacteria bacterium]|nr:30S ribosomal protein S4 [Candidatus Uhrbacteria bacterium]